MAGGCISADPDRIRKNGAVRDQGRHGGRSRPDHTGAEGGCEASPCSQAGWPDERDAERSSLGAARPEALSLRSGGAGVASSPLVAGWLCPKRPQGGFGRDTRPIAGTCGAGDTGATGGAPCHYCKAGSDRAGAGHSARLGHHVSHGSGSDKGRTHKGLARFAQTLPALTPSHLCNNPRAIAAPFNRKGEPNMHFHPTRPMAHQPKPPPTCTAPRARHGGVHRDTQRKERTMNDRMTQRPAIGRNHKETTRP